MSHYYAKEMFNPVLVSPTFKIENSSLSKDVIEVHVISELLEELKNLRLEISIQRFDSVQYAHQQNFMIGNYFFIFNPYFLFRPFVSTTHTFDLISYLMMNNRK